MADNDVQAGQKTDSYGEFSSDDENILHAPVVGSARQVGCGVTATATAKPAPTLPAARDALRQIVHSLEDMIDDDLTPKQQGDVVALLVQTTTFLRTGVKRIRGYNAPKAPKQVRGTSVYVGVGGAAAGTPTEQPTEAAAGEPSFAEAKERIKEELPHGAFKKINDFLKDQVVVDVKQIVNGLKLCYKADKRHEALENVQKKGMMTCIEVYANAIHKPKTKRRRRDNTEKAVVGGAVEDVVEDAVEDAAGGAEDDPNVCPSGSATDTESES